MPTIGIDVHKTKSQVVVVSDDDGETIGEFAAEYAGASAVLEATSNYYAIYDALNEHLEVSVARPPDLAWIVESSQKTDRADAKKLAELHRLDGVPESYVPPAEIRECRALARGRKKLVEQRTDCKNEVHAILDQNGVQFEAAVFSEEGRERLAALDLDGADQVLLDQWLETIDALDERIHALDRRSSASAGSFQKWHC